MGGARVWEAEERGGEAHLTAGEWRRQKVESSSGEEDGGRLCSEK